MQQVNISLYTSSKAPVVNNAEYIYALSCREKNVSGRGKIEGKISGHRLVMVCAIEALKRMTHPARITIYTNSRYLMNGHGYLASWKENGWIKPDGKPVKNADLWQEIYDLQKPHTVKYKYAPNMDLFS